MDDEKLALQLDLTKFESMFELKSNEMSEEVRLRKEAGKKCYLPHAVNLNIILHYIILHSSFISSIALKKLAEQITVIESNRARNLGTVLSFLSTTKKFPEKRKFYKKTLINKKLKIRLDNIFSLKILSFLSLNVF